MRSLATVIVLAALSAVALAEPSTNRFTLLTIREDGHIDARQTNSLATVSQLAELQADMLIAAEKARVAEDVYRATTGELVRVATQLVDNQAVVYRRYFIDSFASTMIINPETDRCWISGFEKAPAERQTVAGRVGWDVYYAFHSDSGTDIQMLKGIFKVSASLSARPGEWDYLDEEYVTDPTPSLGPITDPDGNVFEYSYRATLYLPEVASHFVAVAIQPQAADADGATIVMYGGDRGGLNGTVAFGDSRIEFVGGRAVEFTAVTEGD